MSQRKDVTKDIQRRLKDGIKKIPVAGWFIIPCVLFLGLFVYSLNFWMNAQSTGGAFGEASGKLAGRAIGSLEGLTKGQLEGYAAGKEEGLSANDTTAELAGKIQEAEKLEVLVASGTYSDVLSIGKEESPDYAALLSQKYNAVFTIDLSSAVINLEDDGLHILLEQPQVEFIPVGEIEKVNEFQKKGFVFETGSAEDGWKAALNSMDQITVKAQEQLQNNDSLMQAARSAARTQLTQLVNAVSLSKPEVLIEFQSGGEE